MRRGHTREEHEVYENGSKNPWSGGMCRGGDDDDETEDSVAPNEEEGLEKGLGLAPSSANVSAPEAPAEDVPMSSTAEVDARRTANEASRRPAVRSVWLSTYGGLGYQQSRLGDAMFTCVRHDAAPPLAALLAPLHWRIRAVVPAAATSVLLLVRFIAWVLEPPQEEGAFTVGESAGGGGGGGGREAWNDEIGSGSAPTSAGLVNSGGNSSSGSGSIGGEAVFWIGAALILFLATLCALAMPDSGVTASYRDEWDRTPLHHAAMHQAPQCAAVLMQHVKNKAKSELLKSQQNKSWGGCFLPFQRHNSSSEEFGIKSSNRVCAVHGFKPRSLRAPLPKGAKSPALKAEESFVDAQDWALATPLHLAAAAGDAQLCAILLDLEQPPPNNAAAGAAGGSAFELQAQPQTQLSRLPGKWGSQSRGWFDATNRRPYELVPNPILGNNGGNGNGDGGNKPFGSSSSSSSSSGSNSTMNSMEGSNNGVARRRPLGDGKEREAPNFAPPLPPPPPPPPSHAWKKSNEEVINNDHESRQRGSSARELTAAQARQLKLMLGAPSGEVGEWLAHELFPILPSGSNRNDSGVTGAGAAGSIALGLSARLEREEARACSDTEPGLVAHLKDAALNAPVISISPQGRDHNSERGEGGTQLTPLGLAIVALAEATADGASPVNHHSGSPLSNTLADTDDARAAAARAAIGCLLALGANPNATDSLGRSALALSKVVGLQRCDSSLYQRLVTAAAAAAAAVSTSNSIAAASSFGSSSTPLSAATVETTTATTATSTKLKPNLLDSTSGLTAVEATAARAEAAAVVKHFSIHSPSAAADAGSIQGSRPHDLRGSTAGGTEDGGGNSFVFCSPCGQQPLPAPDYVRR